MLFLAYQVVQFPLTFGDVPRHVFYFDLVFQVGMLVLLFSAYDGLRKTVKKRWDGDDVQQDVVAQWLDKTLAGLNVKPARLRTLALSVFGGSFAPAFLVSLPMWLDELAAQNKLLIEALRASSARLS